MILKDVLQMIGFMGKKVAVRITYKDEVVYSGYVDSIPKGCLYMRVSTFKADQYRKNYIEVVLY